MQDFGLDKFHCIFILKYGGKKNDVIIIKYGIPF